MTTLEWSNVTRRFDPIEVYNRLNNMGPMETHGSLNFAAHGYPVVASVMAMIIVVSLVIGCHALNRYRPRLAT